MTAVEMVWPIFVWERGRAGERHIVLPQSGEITERRWGVGMSTVKRIYYRYLRRFKLFRSLAFLWKQAGRQEEHAAAVPTWRRSNAEDLPLEKLTVAMVCDQMTWETFQGVCRTIYLTPSNWYETLETRRPHAFFCEATWQGLEEYDYCWEGKVARDCGIWPDNRRTLRRILAYCRAAGIPTIFWNKEDPGSDSPIFRFTDTAMLFDHIATTAGETIPDYLAQGHKSVHLMPFGFSPRIFYPLEKPGREQSAVFFGSWYSAFPQRCADMEQLFEQVLAQGMDLTIYDRNFGTDDPNRQFPKRYRPFLRPAVAYRDIPRELEQYRYALNLNTATDSGTMCARRVFELMACGRLIISNESAALRSMFPNSIWFMGEDFDLSRADECIRQNQDYVLRNCTMQSRFFQLLKEIGLLR